MPGPVSGTVLVRCSAKDDKPPTGQPLRIERGARAARYERVVPVSWDADVSKAKTDLRDGLLTVVIPKRTSDEKK